MIPRIRVIILCKKEVSPLAALIAKKWDALSANRLFDHMNIVNTKAPSVLMEVMQSQLRRLSLLCEPSLFQKHSLESLNRFGYFIWNPRVHKHVRRDDIAIRVNKDNFVSLTKKPFLPSLDSFETLRGFWQLMGKRSLFFEEEEFVWCSEFSMAFK